MSIFERSAIPTLDHMTHIDNLDNIIRHGLLSHNNAYKQRDISNREVNGRRNKKDPIYGLSIHDYVPFYFNPRNAMMYKNKNEEIIILGFRTNIFDTKGMLFTDKNAATDNVKFYADKMYLSSLNWSYIYSDSWKDMPNEQEIKQAMMAEVLVPHMVPIRELVAVYVKDAQMQRYIVNKYGVPAKDIQIAPRYFFA